MIDISEDLLKDIEEIDGKHGYITDDEDDSLGLDEIDEEDLETPEEDDE